VPDCNGSDRLAGAEAALFDRDVRAHPPQDVENPGPARVEAYMVYNDFRARKRRSRYHPECRRRNVAGHRKTLCRQPLTAIYTDALCICDNLHTERGQCPLRMIPRGRRFPDARHTVSVEPRKHHGTLDKFVGDMIMAFFNAPLDDPNHSDHAVQMGLAMLEELDKLNHRWCTQGKPKLDIGVGINTGEMIVGNVGSEKTLSYTVIGDNVNLGARLESLNKEYNSHIIISEFTLAKLKGQYHTRSLGSVKVKGKARAIDVYEVCRSGEESRPR